VSTFTDAKTWFPGIEIRNGSAFARDVDASVVVPSKGNAMYTTRVVDANGNPLPQYYGATLGGGVIVLGTGNPADSGVAYNTVIQVLETKTGNTAAKIHVVPPTP
jgi:immune inhibitor A